MNSMVKELRIHTVIVSGDLESFKAAFSRSVLGVTFKKFKRKRSEFYKYRTHNLLVTQRIVEKLYEHLLSEKILKDGSLRDLKLKTDYTIKWSDDGKILAVSDIEVSIYLKVGTLQVERMEVIEKPERIKMDFFYSDFDASSQKLKPILSSLISSIGRENFDYNEYDFLSDKGKKHAQIYNITLIPAIVIDDKVLVNPNERQIRETLEGIFDPKIMLIKPKITIENKTKNIIHSLATTLPKA